MQDADERLNTTPRNSTSADDERDERTRQSCNLNLKSRHHDIVLAIRVVGRYGLPVPVIAPSILLVHATFALHFAFATKQI